MRSPHRTRRRRAAAASGRVAASSLAVLASALALHCGSGATPADGNAGGGPGAGDDGIPVLPFEAVAPRSYVAKVKNLLTGLPPTADDVARVTADPNALAGLIDTWLELPEAKAKLIEFFANSFQQTQFVAADVEEQIGGGTNAPDLILPAMRESFARTALALADAKRPFNETLTTRSFMMTTALMAFYGFIDVRRRDDAGAMKDKLHEANPTWKWMAVDASIRAIPLESSLDVNSPDFMVFSVPYSKCMPRTYTTYTTTSNDLMSLLFGTMAKGSGPPNCAVAGVNNLPPILSSSDFTDWRMVTIRAPRAGETKPRFFDLPLLRSTNELVVDMPRVGFFSTPAFFANWPTNVNNLARVTTNQTLIVSLGASMNPESATTPISESGLDGEHAAPGTVCYGCHKSLDPMRLFFRKSYSLMSHEQLDPVELADAPAFSFYGVTATGNTIDDFASILAKHPRFPFAWAQKLCAYADSAPCSDNDPEFARVVAAFTASGLDFKRLIRELFASPLVTGAGHTKTFDDRGVVVSLARYDHFCAALTARLGVDACNLPAAAKARAALASRLASNIPGDGYSRGSENPVLITDPGMFIRSATENLCELIALEVVDGPTTAKYQSASKDAAMDDFVANLMGLPPSDTRAADVRGLLGEHYDAIVAAGGKPADALRSTFVLTCVSPLVTGIGL